MLMAPDSCRRGDQGLFLSPGGMNAHPFPLDLLGKEAAERLIRFVSARQKEDGGFGLTPRLPATVEDTYYGVRILELLGKEALAARTRSYLDRLDWSVSRRAKIIHAILYLRRKFACPMAYPHPFFPASKPLILEEIYYWHKIAQICEPENDDLMPRFDLTEVALPADPIMREVRYYLALKADCLAPSEVAHWVRWVQACQTPDGGFGFKPGTTAFMDNVLPALEVLRQLGHAPRHVQKLLDFILACQTRAGGFARTSGGVAFLESSFQAVKSLQLLREIASETGTNSGDGLP
jgi:hypothetical protein